MIHYLRNVSTALCLIHCLPTQLYSQQKSLPPKLIVCGGGALPEAVFAQFRQLAGPQPRLVIIPTASQREVDKVEVRKLWQERGFEEIQILHTTNREVASTDDFVSPLKSATAVWFSGGLQQRIADAYLGTLVEEELHALLRRGGVIGGTSAGAAIQSRVMIASGTNQPKMSTGLGLLEGVIVDQHFLKRNRVPRLLTAVRSHPKLIGLGIDEGTAVVVNDGQAKVVGRSFVLRMELVEGRIRVDALGQGDTVRLPDR